MKIRNFLLACALICLLSRGHLQSLKKPRKQKSLAFGKNKKSSNEDTIIELDDEKEIPDIKIDYEDPRANIEAVHITLGDYFSDRTSENIYRIGFMLKNEELRDHLAVKLKFKRATPLPKVEGATPSLLIPR